LCRHVRTRDRGIEAGMWVMWWSVAVVLSAVDWGQLSYAGEEELVQVSTGIDLQNMIGGRNVWMRKLLVFLCWRFWGYVV
jgi:hypothetical protein